MNKKIIIRTLIGLFIVIGGMFTYKYAMKTFSEMEYKSQMGIINDSYQNKRNKALIQDLDITGLNKIPEHYIFIKNKSQKNKLIKEFNIIKPLYTNQYYLQKKIPKLFDDKHKGYYANNININDINLLNTKIGTIYNLQLQEKLVDKLDTINLWITQTNNATNDINNIYKEYQQKKTISDIQYQSLKSDYSLIKNMQIKNDYNSKVKEMLNNYEHNNKIMSSKNKAQKEAEIKRITDQSLTNNNYVKGNVNVTVVSKIEQDITKQFQNLGINDKYGLFIDKKNIYTLLFSNGYYKISKTIPYSGDIPSTDNNYKINFGVNISNTNIKQYNVLKNTVFVLNGNNIFDTNSVINIGNNTDLSSSDYINLNTNAMNPSIVLIDYNQNPLIITTNMSNKIKNNAIQVSKTDLETIAENTSSDTVLLISDN